jgi:hypothetical protein
MRSPSHYGTFGGRFFGQLFPLSHLDDAAGGVSRRDDAHPLGFQNRGTGRFLGFLCSRLGRGSFGFRGGALSLRRYAWPLGRKGMLQGLEACPACGKHAGVLIEEKASRFPFRVQCRDRTND